MTLRATLTRIFWPPAGLGTRAASDYVANVQPALRAAFDRAVITESQAATIPSVYRALQILTTAASQLSLDVERGGELIDQVPAIIRRPSLSMSRSDFIESLMMALAVNGNAFIRLHRGPNGEVIELEPLTPHLVTVARDLRTNRLTYGYDGKTLSSDDVEHLAFIRLPGRDRGIGPIQAAQPTLRATSDMRDYMGGWFDNSGQPAGVLSSDQALTGPEARTMRNMWNGLDADGAPIDQAANPSRIHVLGKGMHYEPILISPKDAMWLEAQAFTTLEIARLFGIPTSLMYAAIEGNSLTYSNVEQEWLAFTRFTLMQYLRKIEEALTNITPRGQVVRFRLETLLRSDTKTRYESYGLALTGGWMTPDEVRAIENMPPLTAAQRKQIAPAPPAAASQPQESPNAPTA